MKTWKKAGESLAVVGRIVASKNAHKLILKTCDYVTLHGKKRSCRCDLGYGPWDGEITEDYLWVKPKVECFLAVAREISK
jgi:hypothetical protein